MYFIRFDRCERHAIVPSAECASRTTGWSAPAAAAVAAASDAGTGHGLYDRHDCRFGLEHGL